MLIFSKEDLSLVRGKEKEWVITNGLGSYCSSTILGLNTRKYHGLLIAALNRPINRTLLVSKFEEEVVIGKNNYSFSVNKYPGVYHPQGYKYLDGFVFNFYPTFNYHVEGIDIVKSICMVRDHNAAAVSYKINSNKDFKFVVKPFVNSRDYHGNTHEPEWVFNQDASQRTTVIRPSYGGAPAIIIGSDKANYKQRGFWIFNMEYEEEKLRGNDFYDNHFCPGEFTIEIKKGRNSVNFLIVGDRVDEAYVSFDNLYSSNSKEYEKFFEYETNRIKSLVKLCYTINGIKEDYLLPYLISAADSFVVRTSSGGKSVIAGYHWFDDYGRDAMISLPGLCLVTGRIEDAKQILLHYAKHCKAGVIHNRITRDGEIYYNSVDTSLWFIHACYKFYKYTNNLDFIRLNLWGKIKEIITTYKHSSLVGFRMDKDGLIVNESNEYLTWMDTKYTVRKGKCIEINALWYNALKIAELFAKRFKEDFEEYLVLSEMVKKSFNEQFWYYGGKYLYDRIEGNFKDSDIRPNQIFAVSLPFRILSLRKEHFVVKKVTEELLTPYGLRSLSKKDKGYIGIYRGNQDERDRAYHNGIVWGWLLGPYITAYLRIHNYSAKGKEEAREKILKEVVHSLKDSGVGTINEIYDGDFPFKSRGCISQAWSVAEIIRAYVEDVLNDGKLYK